MAKSADAFRTISEVAEWLDTPAHVLRFWESKFSQVKPVKRAGGRRYYRPQDMMLLGGIKKLLHDDGMTIKSVQKLLRQEGVKHVAAFSADPSISGSYSLLSDELSPEPATETSRVVSFKSASGAVAAPDTETAPAAEETPLPFPSFLSGDKSMPAAPQDPEPDAASEDDAPAAEEETPPAPMITIDIMSMLSKMSLEDVRAREAELRPLMDKIRAELDRTA
ncbi:MAG: MerR family transcriptional regulator [Pseudomonadota bacterium]